MCRDCLTDDECEGEDTTELEWDATIPVIFLLALAIWSVFYAIFNR
jgi:hypothetical protein